MKMIDNNAFENTDNSSVDDDDSFLNDLDFIKLLIVAKTNLHWLILIVSIGLFAAYGYNRYSQPVFESSSTIKLDIKSDASALGFEEKENANTNLSGEVELIQSKLIHERALSLLNMEVSYFAEGNINSQELYKSSPFRVSFEMKNPAIYDQKINVNIINNKSFNLGYESNGELVEKKYYFGQAIENNDFKFVIFKDKFAGNLEGSFSFVINSQDALLGFIAKNLTVAVVNSAANTIQIAFKDHNGFKSKDVIQAIDSVYLVESLQRKFKAEEQTIGFLNEQLAITERNLNEYENKLENFTIENKTTSISGEVGRVLAHGEELKLKLAESKVQMSVLDQLKSLMLKNESVKQHLPTLSALPDVQITNGILQLNKLQQDKEKLLATSKSTTFAAKNKEIEIENVKNALLELILQNKKLLYEAIIDINNKILEEENTFYKLPSKETELTRLKRFYSLYEKFYLMLIDKKAEYGMTKAGAVAEFIVLAQPVISKMPISPKKATAYMIGGGIGFAIGLFLIFFKYLSHNTINNVGELEKATIAPVLGFVPVFGKAMDVSRLVVDKNPKSPVIEALRSIRTNLEFLSSDKNKKLISVTSTISGEGKTFVAINLGGVIAFSGTRVVIIDMDMRKPKINVGFGVDNDKGMSTVLIGKHRVEDCIHRSTIDTLDFITSGPTPPNPSELILKPEFDEVMTYLKSRYDIIIIDTPPVGLVTDGILVMRKVDLPIYVVRAEYSKKGFEKNINKLVRQHGFKNLSVILNAFNNMLGSYGYGYQYGYGYGYGYYGENEKEEESFFSKIMDFFRRRK
jgi:capsular exopolysaccharide synthesis family protein